MKLYCALYVMKLYCAVYIMKLYCAVYVMELYCAVYVSAVCDPPCQNGLCMEPSLCVCDANFNGYSCDEVAGK